MSIFLWILSNSVTLICFTVLALKTGKWWIVLLAALFKNDLRIVRTETKKTDGKTPIYVDDGRSEEDTPRQIAEHRNCTVIEMYDPVTNEISYDWHKQPDTESEIYVDRREYEELAHGE